MAAEIDITMYTTPRCGYCLAAKELLRRRGVDFIEVDVMADPDRRREMMARSGGGRTVPQIFIGASHVGGFTELRALALSGELDRLLAGEGHSA